MKKIFQKSNQFVWLGALAFAIIICTRPNFVLAATAASASNILQNAKVEIPNPGLVTRVAPGDSVPIVVKLLNFSAGERIDVFVSYVILNSQNQIVHSEAETVAVQTTASFIRLIQVPADISPGDYAASVFIKYEDQKVTARSKFSFKVENKYFGLFQSDFIKYGIITILLGLMIGALGHELFKQVRVSRLKPFDYSNIPKNERAFYELLSDTILEMRERVGDSALDIAGEIDGLAIDRDTGRVLKISQSPSKIIATLVAGYESALGKRVSFTFRKIKKV